MRFSKMTSKQIEEKLEQKLLNLPDSTATSVKTYEVIISGRKFYFKNYDYMYQQITFTNTLDGVVSEEIPLDIHFYCWQIEFTSVAIQILKGKLIDFAAF